MEQPIETTLYSLDKEEPVPTERRSAERHLTLYRVGLLDLDGRRELCLIKNISSGGMLIRAYCTLAVGEAATIELKCGQPVHGTISWVAGHAAGIRFNAPIDVLDILSASGADKRPRMPRVAVNGQAMLRQNGEAHPVALLDISQGGVRVETHATIALDSPLVVSIVGLPPQRASLCWRDGPVAGLTFHGLLPLVTLIDWLREQREGLRRAG